ncbi:MAG: efflux RND transporter periplasmic adaptor subunit [Candidatus Latescibacteria bacterium]|nr:efflux RND transporter periplasmic adaptor subunit [bacterium]MBD3423334.1 efflux RND transporter periplasmic adaptor subunit [Candidatus Latescibacterota bacterium]
MKKIIIATALLISSCGGGGVDTGADLPAPVSIKDIKFSSIQEFVEATGTVTPMKKTTLKSKNSGYYQLMENSDAGRPFTLGDRVTRDEMIIRLENPELENNVMLDSKKLELETSELEYKNQKALYEKGGVTYRELINAEKAMINARYNYQNARIQLANLEIRAPFEGEIAELPYYTPGTEIEAGRELVTLMNYRTLRLELNIPGAEFNRIEVGQEAGITHYLNPDDTLSGVITEKGPVVDSETRSFKVNLRVENSDLLIKPGMFVKASITVLRRDSTIVIPRDIILMKDRGKTVYVVEKGAARERVIETGIQNADSIEVLSGLKENERLVVKGFETLKNRSKVKVLR